MLIFITVNQLFVYDYNLVKLNFFNLNLEEFYL